MKTRNQEKAEKRDGEEGGGEIVLTPACLFYLRAQHGYGCCAAPSHRDMTASLCSHTIYSTTHTQRLSLLPRPVTPHPIRASLSPADCPAVGHCLSLIHTHERTTHTSPYREVLNHTLLSSSPPSSHFSLPLCPTGLVCCCSHT